MDYVELLDKSNYLNHYYFVSLVAFMLCWLPTTSKTPQVPRLSVTSIRLLLAVVYFYAGLAKLNPDWLFNAQPLAMWLPQHTRHSATSAAEMRRAPRPDATAANVALVLSSPAQAGTPVIHLCRTWPAGCRTNLNQFPR